LAEEMNIDQMTLAEIEVLIRERYANIEEARRRRSELEVQLHEVTAAIARLESRGAAVPDALRELKLACHRELREVQNSADFLERLDARLAELRALMPGRDWSEVENSASGQTAITGVGQQRSRTNAVPPPTVDPYEHAAALAREAGPADGQVTYEKRGRRYTMLLASGGSEVRVICRYCRNIVNERRWWFGIKPRDLEEADWTCLLLCDERGSILHAAMLPHDWLRQVSSRFSPRKTGGYNIDIRERSGEIAIYSREWRHPLNEWLDNWEGLWPA